MRCSGFPARHPRVATLLLPSAASANTHVGLRPSSQLIKAQRQQQQQQQLQQQQQQLERLSCKTFPFKAFSSRIWGTATFNRYSSTSAAAAPPSSASPNPSAPSAAAAAAGNEEPYRFKSSAHRDMVVLSTRLHLQDLLLQRFGRLKTAECQLLRKVTGTPLLLLRWAELLVQQNPGDPPADAYYVPPQLYDIPDVKALLRRDPDLRWLMQRIDPGGLGGPCDAAADCVPIPHYPSVLLQQLPQFPYEPQQLEFLRDTYGLLKWPFKPIKGAGAAAGAAVAGAGADAGADAAASLKRGIRPISEAEPTPEGVATAVAAIAAAVDSGDVQRANSQIRTKCSTNAIYAPDETETGAYVW